MLQIQKLLFPTDFSEGAEHALPHAISFAKRYEAEVHALHVVPPGESESSPPVSGLEQQKWMDAGENVQVLQRLVHEASASTAILNYADKHDVDLIVMGTHGRRGLDRLRMGSVAEEVVRRASCPVFTVRPTREASAVQHPISRILVPVDFSEFSRTSISYAKELAAAYDASLDLLHITEDAIAPTTIGIEPVPLPVSTILDRYAASLKELAVDAGVSARIHAKAGHPAAGLIKFIVEEDVDLVVIATHGRTGISRLLIGSVTEKVVRLAPCPVFTIKSFGKSLLA